MVKGWSTSGWSLEVNHLETTVERIIMHRGTDAKKPNLT